MKYTELKNLQEKIDTTDMLLVVFKTDWCGECKMMVPGLLEVQKIFPVAYVNRDSNAQWTEEEKSKWNITFVPTTFLFKNKKEVFRKERFLSKQAILDIIEKHK